MWQQALQGYAWHILPQGLSAVQELAHTVPAAAAVAAA